MGLDISAYSNIKFISDDYENGELEEKFVRLYANPAFIKQADKTEDGWYETGESMEFRAGSYSTYNYWREKLAEIAGYGTPQNVWDNELKGPFTELINFSDCEGIIGPKTCKKLANDFENLQISGTSWFSEENKYFWETFEKFKEAFELGSKSGCVKFH